MTVTMEAVGRNKRRTGPMSVHSRWFHVVGVICAEKEHVHECEERRNICMNVVCVSNKWVGGLCSWINWQERQHPQGVQQHTHTYIKVLGWLTLNQRKINSFEVSRRKTQHYLCTEDLCIRLWFIRPCGFTVCGKQVKWCFGVIWHWSLTVVIKGLRSEGVEGAILRGGVGETRHLFHQLGNF